MGESFCVGPEKQANQTTVVFLRIRRDCGICASLVMPCQWYVVSGPLRENEITFVDCTPRKQIPANLFIELIDEITQLLQNNRQQTTDN